MTESKVFEITYPGAIAGVVITETSMGLDSLEQIVTDTGGAMEKAITVRPNHMAYTYEPIAHEYSANSRARPAGAK